MRNRSMEQTTARTHVETGAAPSKQTEAWWTEQDPAQGRDVALQRPSVTTGAPLPWRGATAKVLGPPRAFQARTSAMPKITVQSALPTSSKVAIPCKVLVQPSVAIVPPTPFAAQGTASLQQPVKEEMITSTAEYGPIKVEADAVKIEPELACEEQPKQHSLQSCESEEINELRFSSGTGQTITTAQDIQGGPPSVAGSSSYSEAGFKQSLSCPVISRNHPQLASIAARTSLPTSLVSITTGQAGMLPASRALDSVPAGDALFRENDRRHNLKRTAQTAFVPLAFGDDGLPNLPADFDTAELEVDDDAQRRLRRRHSNQESARRVKEKREAELRRVNDRISLLEAEQDKWRRRCSGVATSCEQLQHQLNAAQNRWANAISENQRLQSELEYLHQNTQLGWNMEAPANDISLGHMDQQRQPFPTELHGGNVAEDNSYLTDFMFSAYQT